ncbi:pyrophosphatase [Candidatus Roizmanbacteria bacterium CG_4_10_14_0_8_um_filter_39_9]|uniref:Pyrophosphatase n=1 Tax=Candidatus Roizmanbacteria bacterium CG_4_10_14_0_8_um_filter_39_9 TaxID=1974829 RepID=A0A2M7QDP6_9BACT|nr:MAG: pyrophosphatase [Candidatus Roizmanbacteria bacterium CG_4_10_14_0_8_um_filter_39_9]
MEIVELMRKIEAVSLRYSKKYKIKREPNWFVLKLQEEMGELTQSYLMMKGSGRHKNKSKGELRSDFEKELADVFCHVLLLAKSNKVDIERAVDEKWLTWYKKYTKAKK